MFNYSKIYFMKILFKVKPLKKDKYYKNKEYFIYMLVNFSFLFYLNSFFLNKEEISFTDFIYLMIVVI